MRALVYGAGATGSRAARQLLSAGVDDLIVIETDSRRSEQTLQSLGTPSRGATIASLRFESRIEKFFDLAETVDVVVLATGNDHTDLAEAGLRSGCHVVSTADDLDSVDALYRLDQLARDAERTLVIGAAFAPGLTDVLARHGARKFDSVEELHVAKFGTGGPECARQHHRSLRDDSLSWRDGEWVTARGGSGRELYWFPDPVGGLDCYQAAVPDALILHAGFPDAVRVTARVAATRRDRSTKHLPMLRRPHPEGLIGAVRVELRGTRDGVRDTLVYGALDRPAVASGTVAATAAAWAVDGRLARIGSGGLSELVTDSVGFLQDLSQRGVKAAIFEGKPR